MNREATSDRVGLGEKPKNPKIRSENRSRVIECGEYSLFSSGITAVLTLSTIALDSRTGLPKVCKILFYFSMKYYPEVGIFHSPGSLCDSSGLVHNLQLPLLHGIIARVCGCPLLYQGNQTFYSTFTFLKAILQEMSSVTKRNILSRSIKSFCRPLPPGLWQVGSGEVFSIPLEDDVRYNREQEEPEVKIHEKIRDSKLRRKLSDKNQTGFTFSARYVKCLK